MTMRDFPGLSEDSSSSRRQAGRAGPAILQVVAAALIAFVGVSGLVALPAAHAAQPAAQTAAESHPTKAYWLDIKSAPSSLSTRGTPPALQTRKARTATLDRLSMSAMVAGAPTERSQAANLSPLVISLPHPDGGFQRFSIAESPVMEPGLAAKHPEIKTYAGRGLDDKTATIRMDITPLGLHASVRASSGAWYIDPYYHLDDSLYASYFARDLVNVHGPLAESALTEPQLAMTRGFYHAGDSVEIRGAGFAPNMPVVITVQNPSIDAAPRQTVHAVATAEGTLVASFKADPYKTRGTYTVTATAGRSSATSTYQVVADNQALNAQVGQQLRTYRLALLTDPGYANYFGGSANVTAAKVTLINRVTQVYESETSIRLMLIAGNDALNLDTAAQFSQPNGPCGGTACYPTASVSCSSATLTRTRQVIGLLVGASRFDIGHIAVGAGGGGIASLGVVGGNNKAQGCTGLPTPTGDLFAVDYVAHEMGHQFAGNHTFNGTVGNCSTGNRNAGTSVEPGSGSSIMAYAGICGTDDLQPHSDPYWSQRSFDEIVAYTSAAETSINEVQLGVLSGFAANGQQFQLVYNGNASAAIVRGTNFTAAGVKAAIEGIAGWPAGGLVTVSALSDTAFTITFGGTLVGVNASELALANCTGGCTGFVGEIAKGGTTSRGGATSAVANSAPFVNVPASVTIPVRTPFALTGSATDADNDTLTYLWEQNDRGATGTTSGTGLVSNTKLNGPLFRQFGKRAVVSSADTILYSSPGENFTTTDPTRMFPDMAQIIANNTNAETGVCPLAVPATPTAAEIDCFSEFLPTAAYVGTALVNASPLSLNFRFTARDGRGGINSGDTQLLLAPTAGPFLVTSPNTAVTYDAGSTQTVTWSVANTDVAPVNTANVKISLSTDGGNTYPYVLAASTPNSGSRAVTLPAVLTTTARVKVEALGNVFFDISNADFTIKAAAAVVGDVNGDGAVNCADVSIVKASFGKRTGQAGFDARADLNKDGVVDIRDLTVVSRNLPTGLTCN